MSKWISYVTFDFEMTELFVETRFGEKVKISRQFKEMHNAFLLSGKEIFLKSWIEFVHSSKFHDSLIL